MGGLVGGSFTELAQSMRWAVGDGHRVQPSGSKGLEACVFVGVSERKPAETNTDPPTPSRDS